MSMTVVPLGGLPATLLPGFGRYVIGRNLLFNGPDAKNRHLKKDSLGSAPNTLNVAIEEVPSIVQSLEPLPPIQAELTLDYRPPFSDDLYTRYTTRVLRREGGADWLDALRAPTGAVVAPRAGHAAWLLWGEDQVLWRYAVQILEVLQPVPVIRIRYTSAPERINRRQEWRSRAKIPGECSLTPLTIADDPVPLPRMWKTMTRDVTYSTLRFYTPEWLEPGRRLDTVWHIEPGTLFQASVIVIHTRQGVSVYRSIPGHDVIARWDPLLTDDALQRWRTVCDRHRHD